MRNVLHRVYGDGVCLNHIDFGSCWPFMDRWQEKDFRFCMANTLRDSLLFRLGVWTCNPPPCHMYMAIILNVNTSRKCKTPLFIELISLQTNLMCFSLKKT